MIVARSRWVGDPVDLYRAGKEALLAANVAEAEGHALLAFEDTGSYRLLLPAMSEDPGELERFYEETVAPLAAYDEQYETDLVATVEAYLENDGNVAPTAAQLFTHRHTVRYRLERVRELGGPRHHLDRGAREAQPRAEGDAGARDRPAARPRDRARAPRRARCGAPADGELASAAPRARVGLEALDRALDRPVVVPAEERPQQRGEDAEQRPVGDHAPVEVDVDLAVALA